MKKLMHILFLSCYKATELIERKLHTELSFKERLRLRIHLMMCNACSTYEKQSYILEKGIRYGNPYHFAGKVDVSTLHQLYRQNGKDYHMWICLL